MSFLQFASCQRPVDMVKAASETIAFVPVSRRMCCSLVLWGGDRFSDGSLAVHIVSEHMRQFC